MTVDETGQTPIDETDGQMPTDTGAGNHTTPDTPRDVTTTNNQPLRRQFESTYRAIRRQANFVDSSEFESIDGLNAVVRANRLEEIWNSLDSLHMQLIGQLDDEESISECEGKYEAAECLYLVATATLRKKIEERSEQNKCASEAGASGLERSDRPINVSVNLDHREIKNTWGHFDGSLLKWQSFHDGFVAKVHNDKKMSNVEKFTLLKGSLKGSAEATLGEWHLTEDGYLEAWDRLIQIYNRKYPIIREHLRHFDALPHSTGRATASHLQRLSNGTHEMLRQLRSMQLPVDSWDLWVVHRLHERLDPETAKQWELQRSSDMPTAIEMLSFLDKQASAAPDGGAVPKESQPSTSRGSRPTERVKPENIRSSTPYGNDGKIIGKTTGKTNVKHFPCEACSGDHMVFDCDDYLSLSYSARWAFVKARGLCANCLKRGHQVDNCFSRTCTDVNCVKNDPRHNSTLCPNKVGKKKPLTVRKVEDQQGKD